MIFNIYYINFPKVYEIKMMLGNVIQLNKELESSKGVEGEAEVKGKFDLGTKFLNLFSIEAEGTGRLAGNSTRKVLETFEVKTTKSVILNDILENSKTVKKFEEIKEGELIRIDDLSLSLINEPELRLVKLFTNDAFKGLAVPGANGLDINNLFNSMFKDYAYKLRGETTDSEQVLVKIPMTFESEFESSYSVDDLFIGKVSLVGVYKGNIKLGELKNSLEFFQEIGNIQQFLEKKSDSEIQNSQYEDETKSSSFNPFANTLLKDDTSYHYIDLLSIIQIMKTPKKG